MKYFVYILRSLRDNRYYIGTTNSLKKRIREHNRGLSKSTKAYSPWKLVYYEKFESIKEVYKREKYLKSLKKRKYIENLIKCSPDFDKVEIEDPRQK